MSTAQIISWFVAAITFGTVIMYGCIGETINQKAGGLNLGVPGVMQIGGIAGMLVAVPTAALLKLQFDRHLQKLEDSNKEKSGPESAKTA